MEWLNVQLELMRELGMKVILIGHVPPAWTKAKMNWDPSCWRKYVRWTHAYRDIIVGHLYGHMNLDHFMLLDSKELKSPKLKTPQKKIRKQGSPEPCAIAEFDPEEDPIISVTSAESYLKSLRHAFKTMVMPKKNKKTGEPSRSNKHLGGKWAERYIAVHVGPSVVPNYFPTLRIVEYNISGLVDDNGVALVEPDSVVDVTKKKKKKKPVKRPGETDPTPPTKGTPPGPAYSVQPYSLLGYTQYFLNLTTVNDLHKKKKAEKKKKKKEKQPSGSDDDDGAEAERKMARVRYEVEYDTRTDKVYRLKDLTVPSYVKLAQDIVDATPREDLNKRRKKKKKSPKSPKSLDVEDYDDSDSEIDDYDDSDSDSDTNDHDDSDHDGDLDVDTDKTAGRKNKKKKKKAARKARDKVWHAFVKRAFVGTLEGEELAETYEMRRAGCGA